MIKYMKAKQIFISLVISLCVTGVAHAQNDIQETNYMFNELSFNPAYTGSNNALRATLMGRKQWVGFDYGPLTQTLCVDTKTSFGGLGLSVIADQLGFEQSLHAKILYSYTVQFSEKTALTAGFAGGAIYRTLDGTKLQYQDQVTVDPNGIYEVETVIKPAIDLGLQFLHKDFAIGLSSAHIHKSLETATLYNVPRHFFGYAQYRIKASDKISLVPTVYGKYGSTIAQAEANMNVYFNKKFWLGGSYRLNESAVALAGIILNEQFYIGYAYDFNLGDVGPYSDGTHEIFLTFRKKPPTPQSGFYQSTRLFN